MWLRFDELGLPADRAVSLLPRTLLVTAGGHALIVPAIVGLGAVIALYALQDWSQVVLDAIAFAIVFVGTLVLIDLARDLSIGSELIVPAVVAATVAGAATFAVHELCERILKRPDRPLVLTSAVVGIASIVLAGLALELPLLPHMAIVMLVTAAGIGAIFGTARNALGHRPVYWVVFLSFLLVGAAVALTRTSNEPKLEPVAVLLKAPQGELAGFYIGESGGQIHIAQLRHESGLVEVSADPVEAIVSVSKKRVTRMALRAPAGLGLADEGREEAETLLEDLIVERRAASGTPPPVSEPVSTEKPEQSFAPLASIHSFEPVAPTAVDYFLDNARLLWSFCTGSPRELAAKLTTVEQRAGLGSGGYEQEARCGDAKRTTFSSRNYTRPYGKGRKKGLEGREGFYLDLSNAKRKPAVQTGQQGAQRVVSNVPVYWEQDEEPETREKNDERITYWFFYPYSIPPTPTGVNADKISHEGDWERLSVLVRKDGANLWTPVSVRYHEHDGHVDVPWADVRKAPDETGIATHPRAYVAKGSHATYRRAGKFVQVLVQGGVKVVKVEDDARACPECPLWFTWQKLVDAKKQPWYDFGGAWGQVGSASDFTGPLGPSRWKTLGLSDAPERSLQQASEGAGPVPAPAAPAEQQAEPPAAPGG